MSTQNAHAKDYHLWEYLLVAHPDRVVDEEIKKEKNFFRNEYDYTIAIKTKPHITIANFLATEQLEETLTRWIQNICNLHTSFTVTLNNYSGFPPHTIYLRVQDPSPFKQLATRLKMLNTFIQDNGYPPMYLVTRPHLTIARGLPEHIYERAIRTYASRSFHHSFKVDKLLLLKREGEFDKCQLVNTFTLPPNISLFD